MRLVLLTSVVAFVASLAGYWLLLRRPKRPDVGSVSPTWRNEHAYDRHGDRRWK